MAEEESILEIESGDRPLTEKEKQGVRKLQDIEEVAKEIEKVKEQIREVSFCLSVPEAKEVFVAGDFNQWQVNDRSKMELENGAWVKRLQLKPGCYKYRFVVDGQWRHDPENQRYQKNPFGSVDSLLEVGEVDYGNEKEKE